MELYNAWNNSNISTQAFGKNFKEKTEKLGLIKERRNCGYIWIGIEEIDTDYEEK